MTFLLLLIPIALCIASAWLYTSAEGDRSYLEEAFSNTARRWQSQRRVDEPQDIGVYDMPHCDVGEPCYAQGGVVSDTNTDVLRFGTIANDWRFFAGDSVAHVVHSDHCTVHVGGTEPDDHRVFIYPDTHISVRGFDDPIDVNWVQKKSIKQLEEEADWIL